jgi:hypothetical protein
MRKVTTYILKVTTPCHISAVHDRVFQVVYLIRPPGSTPDPVNPEKAGSCVRPNFSADAKIRGRSHRRCATRKHARKSQAARLGWG